MRERRTRVQRARGPAARAAPTKSAEPADGQARNAMAVIGMDIARLLGEDGNNYGDILDELMGLSGEELLTPPPAGAGGGASSSRTPPPPPPPRGPGRPRSAEPGRRSRTPEQRAHDALMARHRRASETAERVAEAELRTLEWVHDASGSAITANSRRLRTLPPGDARDQAKSDVAADIDRFVNVDLESRAVTSSGCVGVWFACGRRVTSSGCVGVWFACVGALCCVFAACVVCVGQGCGRVRAADLGGCRACMEGHACFHVHAKKSVENPRAQRGIKGPQPLALAT